MRSGESFKSEAIVLRVQPYEESHSLVKLLLPQQGKLPCFARGAQRSRKRFGAMLQPGMHVTAHLKVPRRESSSTFYSLELVESLGHVLDLRGDFQRLQSVMFSLSLLNLVLPDGPVEENIFRDLESYLYNVDFIEGKQKHFWIRLLYWLNLSRSLGYPIGDDEIKQMIRKIYVAYKSSKPGEASANMGYEVINSISSNDLPELVIKDFYRVKREWLRVSDYDWDFSKIIY